MKLFVPTAFTSVQLSWSEHEKNVLLVPASAIIHESSPSLCFNSYFTQLFTGAPSKNPQQLANSCNPNKCLNNAQCIEGKSTFFCVCPPNTSGRLCEKKTTPTTGTTIVVNWFMVWIKPYGLFEWKKVLTSPFTSYNGFKTYKKRVVKQNPANISCYKFVTVSSMFVLVITWQLHLKQHVIPILVLMGEYAKKLELTRTLTASVLTLALRDASVTVRLA